MLGIIADPVGIQQGDEFFLERHFPAMFVLVGVVILDGGVFLVFAEDVSQSGADISY